MLFYAIGTFCDRWAFFKTSSFHFVQQKDIHLPPCFPITPLLFVSTSHCLPSTILIIYPPSEHCMQPHTRRWINVFLSRIHATKMKWRMSAWCVTNCELKQIFSLSRFFRWLFFFSFGVSLVVGAERKPSQFLGGEVLLCRFFAAANGILFICVVCLAVEINTGD